MNLLLKKTRKLGIFHNVFVHIVNSPLLIITLRRYMDTAIMMYVYVRGGERGCEGCVDVGEMCVWVSGSMLCVCACVGEMCVCVWVRWYVCVLCVCVCVCCVCVLCAHLIVDPVYSCSYILKNHLVRDQHIPTLHTLAQLQPFLHPAHIHTTHVFLVEYGRVW